MTTVLIAGATSDMARACARRFAAEGCILLLAARRPDALADDVNDLTLRGAPSVHVVPLDVTDRDSLAGWWAGLDPAPDGVVCAVGTMDGMDAAMADPEPLRTLIDTNLTGPAALLTLAAEAFRQRGSGFIIGISSVAGDRGRGSNYPYGCAKAGFTAFLSGLRHRLADSGVQVMTVLPGFVRTSMTEDMELPAALTANPDQVADDIIRAWKKGKPVVYTRWYWRWIMFVIRHLPEFIFRRMKL